LAFYPAEFAEIDDDFTRNLPTELRHALIDRLQSMRRGPWRKLFTRLTEFEQH
jgi:hypothetical protein